MLKRATWSGEHSRHVPPVSLCHLLPPATAPLRWDWLSLPPKAHAERAEAFRAFTTYKAQSVVLPERMLLPERGLTSVFERMEPMALLALSCFCQRIFNSSDEKVCSTSRQTEPALSTPLLTPILRPLM